MFPYRGYGTWLFTRVPKNRIKLASMENLFKKKTLIIYNPGAYSDKHINFFFIIQKIKYDLYVTL